MRPHTSYLICATPRSGSFLLCEALRNTNLAGRPAEYFGLAQESYLLKYWNISKYDYARYLPRVIQHGTTPNGVFGAKVIWLYFDEFIMKLRQIPGLEEKMTVPDLLSVLFPNLHYIWITRRDKLRQAISYVRALQTGEWMRRTSEPPPSIKEPVFDLESIDTLLQEILKEELSIQQYFDLHGILPFTVVYEELVSAYEETAQQILAYLGILVPKGLVFRKRELQRQADTVTEEWVQRYHQLKYRLF